MSDVKIYGKSLVNIYAQGPITMSVCAPKELTADEVLADVERQQPCGTEHGWGISPDEFLRWDKDNREKVSTGRISPIECDQNPDRLHWLVTA